jgi:hypothetical protein
MSTDLKPEFGELAKYRDLTILGRIIDLRHDTRWRVELRIGLMKNGVFVDKLSAIHREVCKSGGAINIAQAALAEAQAAIEEFLDN